MRDGPRRLEPSASAPAVGAPAPPPLASQSPSDLMRDWVDAPPAVSVICHTYQHAAFIDDALSGFLAQRTEFPFEVLVRDDASTDGTAERVADWATRYPDVVRAFLEPVNSYSSVPGRPSRHRLLDSARGGLLAWCEGDDYWTDPNKLATQVGLLAERSAAAASHHDQVAVRDGRVIGERLPEELRRDRTATELLVGKTLPLRSLVHRNLPGIVGIRGRMRGQVWNGDRLLTVRIGLVGGSVYAGGIRPAVYRRHAGGVSAVLAADPAERAAVKARSYFWISMDLAERGRPEAAAAHLERAVGHLVAGGLSAGVDARMRLGSRLLGAGLRAALGRATPARRVRAVVRAVRAARRRSGRR